MLLVVHLFESVIVLIVVIVESVIVPEVLVLIAVVLIRVGVRIRFFLLLTVVLSSTRVSRLRLRLSTARCLALFGLSALVIAAATAGTGEFLDPEAAIGCTQLG